MKKIKAVLEPRAILVILLGITCVSFTPMRVLALEEGGISLSSHSRLWLEGDSTLHPYASTATSMNLLNGKNLILKGPLMDEIKGGNLQNLSLVISVDSLRSGDRALDRNMYVALKSAKNPAIRFSLSSYAIKPRQGGIFSINAKGDLTIAGVKRSVEILAQARSSGASVELSGKKNLVMSDFGVKPPELMFGMLKVRDPVTIHFDLFLGVEKDESSSKGNVVSTKEDL